jgi:alkanesulfonate monooxygenase SsuD/methylene tetrahydromethanopterin reductase-like flavin-dependent oxidoreductase (luciferase family)
MWEASLQFGIFDHCERGAVAPNVTYQERFAMAQRAEAAGFYAYHLAEHHGTPLSLTPSPNLFMAALAQKTKTLRLGPLVYLLPLYDPYRLAQEICMLDWLSDGRLELGVGRGANPIELSFFGLNPASARERFDEAFPLLLEALKSGRVSHDGAFYKVANAPLDLEPMQRPHPPIWYPSSGGGASLAWAARQGYNTIVNGSLASCADAIKVFQDNFESQGLAPPPKMGLNRYLYIADNDAEAMRVGERAFKYHLDNLTKLARNAGLDTSKSPNIPPTELAEAVKVGWAVVGGPETVRQQLAAIFDKVGNNYLVFAPLTSELRLEWGLRTIELIECEIMPHFA